MTTIKVDTITNAAGTGAPNIPDGVTIAGTALASVAQMEYTSSATEPTSPSDGALWWDSANELFKMYVNGAWYEVTYTPPPPAFLGPRGVFAGGSNGATKYNDMDYVTISTPGNAADFGNLTVASTQVGTVSNGTRGCIALGLESSTVNTINYITVATTGNAADFGDLTQARYGSFGNHGLTRGLFGGGSTGAPSYTYLNTIDYITIATTGNAIDFGDLTQSRASAGTASDATRALWAGGYLPSAVNTIDYVTVDTTGNATDFGDLTKTIDWGAGVSNGTYGVFKSNAAAAYEDDLDVVTIQTQANATVFGLLVKNRRQVGSNAGDGTYGLFAGGAITGGSIVNDIDVLTIATTGNATDFGNLRVSRVLLNGLSGG